MNPPDNENIKIAEELSEELNLAPLTASLLVNRGITTAAEARCFLFGDGADFHDPFLLQDMDRAIERINSAITSQEPIMIFGDYDADGVSSTTIMMRALGEMGANVRYYIPNRFTEGYGPNELAFRKASENGIRLIITVDTGISALHEADVAKELGMDLIITDHHEPGPKLPQAFAIIHPKLPGSCYPFRDLAGVGVAFKVAHALLGRVPEELCEIAAIGTIADLVPLRDENRLIARKGILQAKTTQNAGLRALLSLAKADANAINEESFGFLIGPRINAAGRLGSADPAVELLMTEDKLEAEALASEIDRLNKERQALVSAISEEAIKEVETYYPTDENRVLVIGNECWNPGVIGIVASRLVEKFYRPAIVLSFDREKGIAKGSARSIPGFDLFQNLSSCRELLPHFGGHPMAAGMTLDLDNVGELRARLNDLAHAQLSEEELIPVTELEAAPSLGEISLETIEQLNMLSPFGVANPKPKFLVKNAALSSMRKIGGDKTHLKVTLADQGNQLDGIGFGLGSLYDHISPLAKVSVIGELSINEWNNIRKPQIFLHDIAIDNWQMFDLRGMKGSGKLKSTVPMDTLPILFNSGNLERFQGAFACEIITILSEEDAKTVELGGRNIMLLDLPPSKELLVKLLEGKTPSRLYVHFYKNNSEFFSTMPTREHFKWFYAFLAKKGPFNLKDYGEELAKYRGWTSETVNFMSKVFFELDFVKINNGLLALEKNALKKDLSESKTYQEKLATFTLENDLLYSSYEQLKDWFDQVIQGSVQNEEAVEEWI